MDHLESSKKIADQMNVGELNLHYSKLALSYAAIAFVEEMIRFNNNMEKVLDVFGKPTIVMAPEDEK